MHGDGRLGRAGAERPVLAPEMPVGVRRLRGDRVAGPGEQPVERRLEARPARAGRDAALVEQPPGGVPRDEQDLERHGDGGPQLEACTARHLRVARQRPALEAVGLAAEPRGEADVRQVDRDLHLPRREGAGAGLDMSLHVAGVDDDPVGRLGPEPRDHHGPERAERRHDHVVRRWAACGDPELRADGRRLDGDRRRHARPDLDARRRGGRRDERGLDARGSAAGACPEDGPACGGSSGERAGGERCGEDDTDEAGHLGLLRSRRHGAAVHEGNPRPRDSLRARWRPLPGTGRDEPVPGYHHHPAGTMFWFTWNTFSESYCFFTCWSRG